MGTQPALPTFMQPGSLQSLPQDAPALQNYAFYSPPQFLGEQQPASPINGWVSPSMTFQQFAQPLAATPFAPVSALQLPMAQRADTWAAEQPRPSEKSIVLNITMSMPKSMPKPSKVAVPNRSREAALFHKRSATLKHAARNKTSPEQKKLHNLFAQLSSQQKQWNGKFTEVEPWVRNSILDGSISLLRRKSDVVISKLHRQNALDKSVATQSAADALLWRKAAANLTSQLQLQEENKKRLSDIAVQREKALEQQSSRAALLESTLREATKRLRQALDAGILLSKRLFQSEKAKQDAEIARTQEHAALKQAEQEVQRIEHDAQLVKQKVEREILLVKEQAEEKAHSVKLQAAQEALLARKQVRQAQAEVLRTQHESAHAVKAMESNVHAALDNAIAALARTKASRQEG